MMEAAARTDETNVLLTKEQGIGIISLNRPERLNALSSSLRKSLGRCLDEVASDPEIKVVVIRGEGRAFCAGAELDDLPSDSFAWRSRVRSGDVEYFW